MIMEQEIKAPFNVILLGVIFDPAKRKILIGKRENDKDIPDLSWAFPGGRLLHGEELDKKLKDTITKVTGLNVKNLGSIFSKTYPEKTDLLSVYFLCEAIGGKEKAGGDFSELKWVSPDEVESHFTTSFHSRLKEYIMNLK
jgi:ADP-ribose pyrophosphatase YjhB (NUDIX family)